MKPIAVILLLSFQLTAQSMAPPSSHPATNPKVRAITAFVRLDRPPLDRARLGRDGTDGKRVDGKGLDHKKEKYENEIADALRVLRKIQSDFESSGYSVETIRITTQPLAELVAGLSEDEALAFLAQLDELSTKENFLLNVGPAALHDNDDPATIHLLERALSALPHITASTVIADESGIHWQTIHHTAELIKYVSEHSPHAQGTFNFAATAMLKPLGPFFPGSYHTGAGRQFAIGFEGASAVQEVFARDKGKAEAAIADLTAALTKHAAAADKIGNRVAAETGWAYAGLDPTPAPLGDISIGAAIESFTGARFGSSGTLTAARIITAAVKAVPVKQAGYAGLMVPVMEDKLLAQRWAESTYNIDSLLAYSAVCGTGLDTVPLPGSITVEQIERILSDVASLAVKWNKPLSSRLQPIPNKKPGDRTEFEGAFLYNTIVQPLP